MFDVEIKDLRPATRPFVLSVSKDERPAQDKKENTDCGKTGAEVSCLACRAHPSRTSG